MPCRRKPLSLILTPGRRGGRGRFDLRARSRSFRTSFLDGPWLAWPFLATSPSLPTVGRPRRLGERPAPRAARPSQALSKALLLSGPHPSCVRASDGKMPREGAGVVDRTLHCPNLSQRWVLQGHARHFALWCAGLNDAGLDSVLRPLPPPLPFPARTIRLRRQWLAPHGPSGRDSIASERRPRAIRPLVRFPLFCGRSWLPASTTRRVRTASPRGRTRPHLRAFNGSRYASVKRNPCSPTPSPQIPATYLAHAKVLGTWGLRVGIPSWQVAILGAPSTVAGVAGL